MVLRNDYVLRLVRQLAEAIGRLLAKGRTATPEELQEDLEKSLEDLTGLTLTLVRQLSLEQLLGGLRMGERSDSVRTLAAAEVLAMDADLGERLGRSEEVVAGLRFKAVGLYAAGLSDVGDVADPGCVERALGLLSRVGEWRMPPAVGLEVFRWFESRAEFGRAEDVLFEIVGADGTGRCLAEGLEFYARLLEREDGELVRGGLPREEVRAGIEELTALDAGRSGGAG